MLAEIRNGARCHRGVTAWWTGVEERDLFLSVMTLGEIRRGIQGVRHRDPAKAAALERWLRDVSDAFGPRIIGVDLAGADARGRMSAVALLALSVAGAEREGAAMSDNLNQTYSRAGTDLLK